MLSATIINRIKSSGIAKDSFWAVGGNGLGSALLLFAGIMIARFLGKDLYGEYGVVKTNMLYLAGFATFGFGLTSTRFVARCKDNDGFELKGVIKTSCYGTLIFSFFISLLIFIFARPLALYLDHPSLSEPFRFLSIIIIVKALGVTGIGVLAGLRKFKYIAISSILSGLLMLVTCIPLTIYLGLIGAIIALTFSQIVNTLLIYFKIHGTYKKISVPVSHEQFRPSKLLKFSFPVALQEISFSICNWVGILVLTKLSSMGEVGLYTASAQWNAIILFLPALLSNVVLSHLSKVQTSESQTKNVKTLLVIYLLSSGIPFVIVFFSADYIVTLYGPEYKDLANVLRVMIFSTIPLCCSDIFKSKLMADGYPWTLFSIRCGKDLGFLTLLIVMLKFMPSFQGAMAYAIASVIINILFFLILIISSGILSKGVKGY